jgi:predicted MFS family arabinose efflux permease
MRFPYTPARAPAGRGSMLGETVEGVRYVVAHPSIRSLLLLMVCAALFAKSVIDLFPGFAAQVFSREADGLGLLLSFHGLGAMAGGAWLASRSGGIKGMTHVLTVNLLFMALALLLFASSSFFWLGCLMAFFTGSAFIIMSVGIQTLIQANVDPELRGRVVSVYGMIAQDMPAIGAMMIGGLAEIFGLQLPVAMGAGVCLILWWWAGRQKHRLAAALESETATDKSRKHPTM